MSGYSDALMALKSDVEAALESYEYPSLIESIAIDGMEVVVETAGRPLVELPQHRASEADVTEEFGDKPVHYKHVPGEGAPAIIDSLDESGFSLRPFGHKIGVRGRDRDLEWFEEGDCIRTYRFKTPARVVDVAARGEPMSEDLPVHLPPDGYAVSFEGTRGGQYVLYREPDSESVSLFERVTSTQEGLSKTADDLYTYHFVGSTAGRDG